MPAVNQKRSTSNVITSYSIHYTKLYEIAVRYALEHSSYGSASDLPCGAFGPSAGAPPRIGVRIGDYVVDLSVLEAEGLLNTSAVFVAEELHDLRMALDLGVRQFRITSYNVCYTKLLRHGEPRPRATASEGRAALRHGRRTRRHAHVADRGRTRPDQAHQHGAA